MHGEVGQQLGHVPDAVANALFQAIKGNGGTARLVMLPGEGHGYRAKESTLHVLAEMIEWMDEHVKKVRP